MPKLTRSEKKKKRMKRENQLISEAKKPVDNKIIIESSIPSEELDSLINFQDSDSTSYLLRMPSKTEKKRLKDLSSSIGMSFNCFVLESLRHYESYRLDQLNRFK
jgi:hypothetical protein